MYSTKAKSTVNHETSGRDMSAFLDDLANGLSRFRFERPKLLIAVSGGADSMALLHGLNALREQNELELAAAHFNHQLRGEESDQDAQFVEIQCRNAAVRLFTASADVSQTANCQGKGLEETARQLRYEFLEKTANQEECAAIAVAHNADDQTETILHNILRGTGISGLRGIPESRQLDSGVQVVRPMLTVSREQIEQFLIEENILYRNDASNADVSFTRNRIRHTLLPMLRTEFNPRVDEAIRRLGTHADNTEAVICSIVSEIIDAAVCQRSTDNVQLDIEKLRNHPRHLVRQCFVQLWRELGWPAQKMGFEQWDRLAGLVECSGVVTLPDEIEAARSGNLLVLRRIF